MADGEELTTCPVCGSACLHYWSREGTQGYRGYRRLAPDPATPPPAAPTDRESALLAEIALLRRAAAAYLKSSTLCVNSGYAERAALFALLATPPGAAGQALLAAGDELSQILNSLYDVEHGRDWVGAYDVVSALTAWDQARSGAPGARATGETSGEGGASE